VTADEVTDRILAASTWRYSKASGPGGQHRDHTESRAELIVAAEALAGLPDHVVAALTSGLHLKRRPLRLASQADRSRDRNRATVEANLRARVAVALTPKKKRRATTPSKAAVARRLDQKAKRSQVKSMRRSPERGE
jgi:ribosome-associated protein